ncbi:TM2 domain-containing protein [Corynebacterium falsenii]|uniref:TM2 domain-containing protein n=1 Tax=Corynebacterium falsenii TaxID=108486 RepID=UPI001D4F381F|nr:TM2 domain-containing protein [Corynebacterium falsenii]HJF11586.1 TM2 domain-containing protein [Corynebacterium falsenii]
MPKPYDNYTGDQNSDPYGHNPQHTWDNQSQYGQQPYGHQPYGQYQYGENQYAQQNYAQPQFGQPQFGQQPFDPNYPDFQPTYSGNAAYAPMTEPKSYMAAALLAFFLGGWGAHNFYLGYKAKAVTQLVLCLLGFATAIFIIGFAFLAVVSVWAFIEFIMILLRSGSYAHDANGVPLRN